MLDFDFKQIFDNTLGTLQVTDIIDIIIIAFFVYKILVLVKDSSAGQVFKAIIFIIIGSQVASWLGLYTTHYILSSAINLGIVALVILFQPELRKALGSLGKSKVKDLFNPGGDDPSLGFERNINLILTACYDMSATRTGALMIFERDNNLTDIMKTGTIVNADISIELIENIFYPKSPLHDGAAIFRAMRIAAAGCVLPLSDNMNLARELGTRHRAGVGVSERTDAISVIVSEETGSVSLASGGMLKRHLSRETLGKLLTQELRPDTESMKPKGIIANIRHVMKQASEKRAAGRQAKETEERLRTAREAEERERVKSEEMTKDEPTDDVTPETITPSAAVETAADGATSGSAAVETTAAPAGADEAAPHTESAADSGIRLEPKEASELGAEPSETLGLGNEPTEADELGDEQSEVVVLGAEDSAGGAGNGGKAGR